MNIKPLALIGTALTLGTAIAQYTPGDATRTQSPGFTKRELFEHYCKTRAGIKIYQRVNDVEGILLAKIRPRPTEQQLADPLWPGAAFAFEAYDDDYIATFLAYEVPIIRGFTEERIPITANSRGHINTTKQEGALPGYAYVDVLQTDGKSTLRYKGHWEEPWQTDKREPKGYIKFSLKSGPAPKAAAKYAVTFSDQVNDLDRRNWIASSTVTVYDTATNKVLAEMTRYAMSGAPTNATPAPWLAAKVCPGNAVGASAATRKFVDQVLVPKKNQEGR